MEVLAFVDEGYQMRVCMRFNLF